MLLVATLLSFPQLVSTEIGTADSTAGEALSKTGMELGYNTAVGPVALSVGYGTTAKAQSCDWKLHRCVTATA